MVDLQYTHYALATIYTVTLRFLLSPVLVVQPLTVLVHGGSLAFSIRSTAVLVLLAAAAHARLISRFTRPLGMRLHARQRSDCPLCPVRVRTGSGAWWPVRALPAVERDGACHACPAGVEGGVGTDVRLVGSGGGGGRVADVDEDGVEGGQAQINGGEVDDDGETEEDDEGDEVKEQTATMEEVGQERGQRMNGAD